MPRVQNTQLPLSSISVRTGDETVLGVVTEDVHLDNGSDGIKVQRHCFPATTELQELCQNNHTNNYKKREENSMKFITSVHDSFVRSGPLQNAVHA